MDTLKAHKVFVEVAWVHTRAIVQTVEALAPAVSVHPNVFAEGVVCELVDKTFKPIS